MSRASEYANAVSSLYAQIGEARAREASNKGQIWGGAIANIGDFVSQYPQRKAEMERIKNQAEETALRKRQMEREEQRDIQNDEEDKRINDWFDSWLKPQGNQLPDGTPIAMDGPGTGGITGNDPALKRPNPLELLRFVKPSRAIPIINAFSALQKMDPQTDPKEKVAQLQTFYKGFQNLPEEKKVELYPGALKMWEDAGYIPRGVLPRQWDKNTEAFIMGTGQEPGKTGELVPIPGPNGPVYGEKKPGQPVYEKSPSAGERNPTEWSLIADAAKGDATAKRALEIYRHQHPDASGAQEPLVAVMKDGKSVYVRRSQAEGMTPATTREQGRQMTSGDANRLAEINQSLTQAKELEDILGKTGAGSAVGAALPNVVTQVTGLGAGSKTRQAQIDRVKQIIGKGLEGGVLRKEDEVKYAKILPVIGDAPEVAAGKIRGLQQTLMDKRDALLDALDDANYDTSKYRARPVPEPLKSDAPPAPQGFDVTAPNGKTYHFKTKGEAEGFKARAGIK